MKALATPVRRASQPSTPSSTVRQAVAATTNHAMVADSVTGVVEQGPPELMGRHVFVLHPHQTRFVVPGTAVHVLPGEVPPSRAVLAANLEIALNGMWDARPHVGDRITVIGAGRIAPAQRARWDHRRPQVTLLVVFG